MLAVILLKTLETKPPLVIYPVKYPYSMLKTLETKPSLVIYPVTILTIYVENFWNQTTTRDISCNYPYWMLAVILLKTLETKPSLVIYPVTILTVYVENSWNQTTTRDISCNYPYWMLAVILLKTLETKPPLLIYPVTILTECWPWFAVPSWLGDVKDANHFVESAVQLLSVQAEGHAVSCHHLVLGRRGEKEREMFYLTTHSTHFIYSYMASDTWLWTILIVRKETRCCHIGYSYQLTARVLLYAPSHRQDSTYHGLCYTRRGALAGTRNGSMGPPHEGSIRRPIAPWANALPLRYVPLLVWKGIQSLATQPTT